MALRNIVKEGDELLRKKSKTVTEITPRILQLLDDMKDTLHEANGCGLAAVQVGVLRRIVLVETEPGELIEMINPEIISKEGEQRSRKIRYYQPSYDRYRKSYGQKRRVV